jgi:hypothetical protein
MLVFDTTRARYVWEVPYYPQYYIPRSDVRMEHLRDEDHPQRVQLGSSRLYSDDLDQAFTLSLEVILKLDCQGQHGLLEQVSRRCALMTRRHVERSVA